ncbi:unnamed protein product [Triticum turgidum subsp. durum]|uniref:Uncharacterized protein n=1 Tax=Triticum turgidum subsp. durum TaxID=4567 RepID=A0A9R0VSZ6_TRITD|nr:unnamed protein product [Triticum turgidum subsp. durum]
MSATSELSTRNDGHLIDIAPSPTTGINQSGGGGEIHTEWLRELTSASRSTAVLNDLIGRTPTLWYLGERAPTILRPRSRRADLKALHAVAIGPYHRGDRGLAFDDEAKLPFLRYLQDQCGLDVEQYVAALGAARGCFRDEFADDADAVAADWLRDEDKFVKMLLLDSSFVLVFSLMFGKAGRSEVTRERFILYTALAQYADEIKLDLLVLENQIPFAVVKLLAASCRGLKLRSVEELVLGCFDGICPTRARGKAELLLRETTDARFHHILHLFHWSRVPENKYRLLSVQLKFREATEESDQSEWLMPCARELHRAAVWFRKPSLDGAERHGGDLNMEFRSAAASPMAVMTIPSFHILAYTAALLHSMLAFEKHFHWAHGACVTVHLRRMEGLIRCPQDAALLRRRWILGSVKCTDEEVVDFFRDMAAEAAGVRMPEEYGEMIRAVARHRTRRARRWCGDLILHFLPSPWVSVSLAAVVALIIVPAMLQTIYTILGYQK